MDNVGIVVNDLKAAIAFFEELGLTLQGETSVEGPWVDGVVGLEGTKSDVAFMQTPDGHSKIELTKYQEPGAIARESAELVNTLGAFRVMFTVSDLREVLTRLETHGAKLVKDVVEYGDAYRLCYVRGPEGIVIALAEPLKPENT